MASLCSQHNITTQLITLSSVSFNSHSVSNLNSHRIYYFEFTVLFGYISNVRRALYLFDIYKS